MSPRPVAHAPSRTHADSATSPSGPTNSFQVFEFRHRSFDVSTGLVSLGYGIEGGPSFVEEFRFNPPFGVIEGERERALNLALRALHLVAGVSYFKAFLPPKIRLSNGDQLTPSEAAFLVDLWTRGLGEFAWRNGLDLEGRIRFPVSQKAVSHPSSWTPPGVTAVPIGGGKDSIVTWELLRRQGQPIVPVAVGSHEAIDAVLDRLGVAPIRITRKISPQLLEWNNRGALNGHVPISSILAAVMAVGGVLHGWNAAAFSQERSANVGSLMPDGRMVNHQHSKSLEFERSMAGFLRDSVMTGYRHYSALRPLSELGITRRFAMLSDWHQHFTSCNGAFRITGGPKTRWCLNCPKCRFVQLALAPFLERSRIAEIFGANLLDDAGHVEGFEELAGLDRPKPFECVGETEESRAALVMLCRRPDWRGSAVVERFRSRHLPESREADRLIDEAMSLGVDHELRASEAAWLHALG